MSWGEKPNDLDFHDMLFDGATLDCEVYYSHKECGNVILDIDNTQVQ